MHSYVKSNLSIEEKGVGLWIDQYCFYSSSRNRNIRAPRKSRKAQGFATGWSKDQNRNKARRGACRASKLPGLTASVHKHGWRYEQCMGVPKSLQKSSWAFWHFCSDLYVCRGTGEWKTDGVIERAGLWSYSGAASPKVLFYRIQARSSQNQDIHRHRILEVKTLKRITIIKVKIK